MSLGQVSLLFLLQLGFGSALTFVVNDRAALGPKYYKFAGWVLLACYGLAGSLVWGAGAADAWLGSAIGAAALGTLAFASVSGWERQALERASLALTLVAGGTALALATLTAHASLPAAPTGAVATTLSLASGLGSALTLGFTTWGMILGHWYLVSHDLDIKHLGRLVAPLPWMLIGKAVISGLALFLFWSHVLGPGHRGLGDLLERSPDRILDVVNVWGRIPVGLAVPAVLAFMTRVTVKMERTQPATGILYAMCVLVYLGELMGRMLEGGTGVPL
ncbi:MAG: hypothetical protein ACYTG2_11905 [Planctomycetota bacterium]|jgi:hypothetical protein